MLFLISLAAYGVAHLPTLPREARAAPPAAVETGAARAVRESVERCATPYCPLLAPDEVILYWPDGTVRVRYNTDAMGRRTGTYLEYHENGKLAVKARFHEDRPSGSYETFYENGRREMTAVYKDGLLHGDYEEFEDDGAARLTGKYRDGKRDGTFDFFRDRKRVSRQEWTAGQLLELDGIEPYPRTQEELRDTLDEIYDPANSWPPEPTATSRKTAPGDAETDLSDEQRREQDADREAALRHLMGYRYLSGLAWRDMELDPVYNYYASMAARILVVIGRLDHTPENPGLPADEYRDGYQGTSSSNLCSGGNLRSSIDSYMNDSDDKNIEGVGHRNWCLNPSMLRTGFGLRRGFSAMWSFDGSRSSVPAWTTVPYPAPGWYPVEYFGARHAWSVRLQPGKYGRPEKGEVEVRIWALDDEYLRLGDPLELDHLGFHGHLIVFRPATIAVEPGNRFWVEISGLKGPGKSDRLEYLVEFMKRERESRRRRPR